MFPPSLLEHLDNAVPALNKILADGLAVEHLKHVERYIDDVFRVVAAGFPPGLAYLDYRRCTPIQEYDETIRKGTRSSFDVARSDIYLVEYRFSYTNGNQPTEYFSKYFSLPFVSSAGTIFLGGSRFVITPILADRVISVGFHSVFVRLLKAKLTFNRVTHHYLANSTIESVQVVWSEVYNERKNPNAPKRTVNAHCTLAHYLFAKYGFSKTFQLFGHCAPIIGGDEITEETHPPSAWVICKSRRMPMGKVLLRTVYDESDVRLAIPRDQYTPVVKSLVGGFFYVVDHFPAMMLAEYANSTRQWMILLGHLIWSGSVPVGKLYEDVEDHIASLDEYVDNLMRGKLADIGYDCPDIYTLFGIILENYNEWLRASDDRVNTMYGKELSILPYICSPITYAIVNLYFKLKAAKKKSLDTGKIKKLMDKFLKPGAIFKITREHGEVTTTSTSGDNKALKITSLLVPQTASNRSKKDRVSIADPAKRLHGSIAEVGSFAGLPKAEPTGRSRLNLNQHPGPGGEIVPDPQFVDLITSTQAKFKR